MTCDSLNVLNVDHKLKLLNMWLECSSQIEDPSKAN